jgi:hypothetical protein
MAAALLAVLVVAALLASWLTSDPGPRLVVEKPTGGTIIATGITCGTGGSTCTTTATLGDVIELRVQPDDEYTFASYTGDCAPGGRVLMDGPRTCGATFAHTPGATSVRWPLTLTPPANGTIFTMEGHACGTQGTNCVVDVAEGHKVSLDVQADAGFRVQSYTGDCVADGTTIMDAARTCGAVLVPGVGPPPSRPPAGRDVASAGPLTAPAGPAPAGGGAAGPAPAAQAPGGDTPPATPAVSAPPAAPGAGAASVPSAPPRAAEVPVAALAPAGVPVTGPPPPVRTPTELATKEITTVLQAYREAHSRMDVDGMKRQFPSVDVPRFQQQFRDLKSLTYAFAGDPKLELDLERGRATAVVDVKTENESKAGKKQKPVESKATFLLQRVGITDQWHIELIRYQPK